jgi:hypothetical protein
MSEELLRRICILEEKVKTYEEKQSKLKSLIYSARVHIGLNPTEARRHESGNGLWGRLDRLEKWKEGLTPRSIITSIAGSLIAIVAIIDFIMRFK